MKPLRNWATTAATTVPGKETLPAGGHGCEIRAARIVPEDWGNGPEDKLIVEFEIKEGTQYDGFFARQFENKLKYNINANWGGSMKQAVTDKDGFTNPYFKGFINSVEKSNPGYDFEKAQFDERTLIGKKVGLVFRDEPFESDDGNVYHVMKAAWSCAYDEAKDQPAPKPKDLRKRRGNSIRTTQMQETYDNDDLPWGK